MLRIILFCLVMLVFGGRALAFAAYFVSERPIVDARLHQYAKRRNYEQHDAVAPSVQQTQAGANRSWHFTYST